MCGFVGFVQRSPAPEVLTPMLRRIEHRGPDGEGRWHGAFGDWFVALGHRRLAILDIAGGAQPMSTPEGTAHLTYNGELYNFRELRGDLERRGRVFRTRSDTEVLLRHVEERWATALPRLNGMFAFAQWDQEHGRMLLARDRAGIKPLYYAELPDGGIVFASELSALLQHPRVSRKVCPEGLLSYFFSDYAHAPFTLIDGVKKLAPGHYLEWRNGKTTRPSPYWTLPDSPLLASGSADGLAKDLWSILGSAVERQLVADVPVGVFLSGGIDSSIVAVLAQQHSGRRLETFSIAFDDPTFDESRYSTLVARRIGSRHVEERLTEANLLEVIDLALARLDEPLADPSYLPTFLLSRLASSQVKVVLGGDGGDELFGGYPTYRAHRQARLYSLLPRALRRGPLAGVISRLPQQDTYQSLEWKLKRFVIRWDDDSTRRHLRWMSNLDIDDLARATPCAQGLKPATLAFRAPDSRDPLNAILALDFCTYLPGSVLTKVDRASMAHGLEVRPPMLDNDVIDWAFRMPSSLKVRGARSKYLLQRAALGHLPTAIVLRRKKGFGIPLGKWLRGPLRDRLDRTLASCPLWGSGLLAQEAFVEWAGMHNQRKGDYSRTLWALLVLDEWVRREKIEPVVVAPASGRRHEPASGEPTDSSVNPAG
jgi:asparagine synthase (glutamine-hydrolysing)